MTGRPRTRAPWARMSDRPLSVTHWGGPAVVGVTAGAVTAPGVMLPAGPPLAA